MEYFDRDRSPQAGIYRSVHLSHSAAANWQLDFVGPEHGSGLESQDTSRVSEPLGSLSKPDSIVWKIDLQTVDPVVRG